MKTVLVNKPIHPDVLKRLSEEVEVLTPFEASEEKQIEILSGANGIFHCLGLDITAEIIDRCKTLEVTGCKGKAFIEFNSKLSFLDCLNDSGNDIS